MPFDLVHIYCDGACSPNPGVGGWGALLIAVDRGGRERELSGSEATSTNNRMELTAAIKALEALTRRCRVVIHTDSTYLKNAFEQGWLAKWQRNGWRTVSKEAVSNEDLWRRLIDLEREHEVSWQWVKGHSTSVEHNRCDALAVAARLALATEMAATLQASDLRIST